MDQAYPDINPEVIDRLQSQGIKPYQMQEIPDSINPHKSQYWINNAIFTSIALVGRYNAARHQSLRYMWSTVILAIPLFAIGGKVKLEGVFSYGGHRRTLEEKLDYNPLTRRAWYRALEENNKYQDELRKEISDYELKLNKKK